jgi:hypothetical protein
VRGERQVRGRLDRAESIRHGQILCETAVQPGACQADDAKRQLEAFDFNLHYGRNGDSSGPAIFAVLEREFGLRLEPRKAPVEILIVESAARVPQ